MSTDLFRHPRESGGPESPDNWIPAYAGMTSGESGTLVH